MQIQKRHETPLSVGIPGAVKPRDVLWLLLRLTLELCGRIEDLGFALAVARDFEAKVTGVDSPLYRVADMDGKLKVALKAGLRSDMV